MFYSEKLIGIFKYGNPFYQLADYLKMRPITIYKHAEAGKLPGFKVGSKWRFKKSSIDKWIEKQEKSRYSGG